MFKLSGEINQSTVFEICRSVQQFQWKAVMRNEHDRRKSICYPLLTNGGNGTVTGVWNVFTPFLVCNITVILYYYVLPHINIFTFKSYGIIVQHIIHVTNSISSIKCSKRTNADLNIRTQSTQNTKIEWLQWRWWWRRMPIFIQTDCEMVCGPRCEHYSVAFYIAKYAQFDFDVVRFEFSVSLNRQRKLSSLFRMQSTYDDNDDENNNNNSDIVRLHNIKF